MKNIKQFSKKLLALDYIIAGILILLFVVCLGINGLYVMNITNQLITIDVYMISTTAPFNLDVIATILGVWMAQLDISSGAYYYVIRADHQVELRMLQCLNL